MLHKILVQNSFNQPYCWIIWSSISPELGDGWIVLVFYLQVGIQEVKTLRLHFSTDLCRNDQTSKFRKILRGLLPPPDGFSSGANSLEWKIKMFWNKGTVLEWFLYCLITLRKSIFRIQLVISTEGINDFFYFGYQLDI